MRRWPRPEWVLVGGLLLLGVIGRVGSMMDNLANPVWPLWVPVFGAAVICAAFAVLALIMVRWWRPRVLLVPLTLLVYGPYAIIGEIWGPLSGVLGAALLLTLSAPVSWVLTAAAVAAELALIHRPGNVPPFWLLGIVMIIGINVSIIHFAPVYMARQLDEMDREREWLAAHAVAAERRHMTARLSRTLGADLMTILRALRETQQAPNRAGLERVAELSRAAMGSARSVADAHHVEPAPPPPEQRTALSARLAWWFFVIVLVDHSVIVLFDIATYSTAYPPIWLLCALIGVSGALQLYHGAPRPDGSTPRAWRWTLPIHLALGLSMIFLPVYPSSDVLTPPIVLVLGACVVRIRDARAWAIPALATVLFPLALPAGSSFGSMLYWSCAPFVSAILVYSLCRIPPVTRQLAETRAQAARTAVVAERLRVARDVHDLLGRALASITLKAELAARLLERDADAARAEVAELAPLADTALSELRAIPDGITRASFAEELTSARGVLEAAGSQVTVEHSPTPAAHDQLLAVVLREAVTNVVRHSRAERTSILLTTDEGGTRLHVTNDNPTPAGEDGRTGTGLTNLTMRLTAAGGRLTADRGPYTFTLTAALPVDQSQPASLAI
ncbi:histidine kinase [Nocardia sp. CDC153]|uniref:sensor histidine kinase n=1 Tax=Nocardia sp. CDC153 TaxID=3112167 RepID=UPI002DBC704D|nr:histidine kinase [Nocardia sp. CDC153]MEC3957622.1 histidine kinase [Nocardia sp. CDC153]